MNVVVPNVVSFFPVPVVVLLVLVLFLMSMHQQPKWIAAMTTTVFQGKRRTGRWQPIGRHGTVPMMIEIVVRIGIYQDLSVPTSSVGTVP